MEIGGIRLFITTNASISFQAPEPIYRSFVKETSGQAGSHDIDIQLKLGAIPDTTAMKRLFDSGQSWSLFQDNNDYCFTLHPPSFEKPFWLAWINRDFTKATVYLNEQHLTQQNKATRIISNPVNYPLDQILLMYLLARKQGAILHAAGVHINGKGYIFPGKSGAGKSTITRQFAETQEIKLLSDDRVVVRKIGQSYMAYGTPWPGEAGVAINESMPLEGIFFIKQGTENHVTEMTPQQAVERLMPVTSIPWYDNDVMPVILQFCGELVSQVPAYELSFRPSVEVAHVLKDFITK